MGGRFLDAPLRQAVTAILDRFDEPERRRRRNRDRGEGTAHAGR